MPPPPWGGYIRVLHMKPLRMQAVPPPPPRAALTHSDTHSEHPNPPTSGTVPHSDFRQMVGGTGRPLCGSSAHGSTQQVGRSVGTAELGRKVPAGVPTCEVVVLWDGHRVAPRLYLARHCRHHWVRGCHHLQRKGAAREGMPHNTTPAPAPAQHSPAVRFPVGLEEEDGGMVQDFPLFQGSHGRTSSQVTYPSIPPPPPPPATATPL